MQTTLKLIAIGLLPFLAVSADVKNVDAFAWSDLELRIGIDAENRVDIRSYEMIATLSSPWSWTVREKYEMDLGFEFGLGVLDGEGETAVFGHIGPSLGVSLGDLLPLGFVISSGPALLSEHAFSDLDLGGTFQFISAVGFDYAVTEDWNIGYRYLHISNAGLHDKNPGMNLHAATVSHNF
ncbi:MAG: hypothetical protein GVY36_03470 [Verrucomicrobia bacterium]|jgi:hypothetical protein|nr:hypothetical protein [Verrucomicrobiota bacterium]